MYNNMCPCGQVVRRLICNQKIPSSNLGGGFLALAQLAERWTVIVFCGYPQVAGSIPASEIFLLCKRIIH